MNAMIGETTRFHVLQLCGGDIKRAQECVDWLEGHMNKHTQAANTSGIKRDRKRLNAKKKSAQHAENIQARAAENAKPKR